MNCQWTRQVSELAIRLIQAMHGIAVAVFYAGIRMHLKPGRLPAALLGEGLYVRIQ